MSASFLKGSADRNHMGNNQVRYNSYKVVNLFFGIAIMNIIISAWSLKRSLYGKNNLQVIITMWILGNMNMVRHEPGQVMFPMDEHGQVQTLGFT